jgi:hypothetical protein
VVKINIIVMNLVIPTLLELVYVSTTMMMMMWRYENLPVGVVSVVAIHGVIMISNLFVIVIHLDYMIT